MKKCNHCGHQNPNSAAFCANCGKQLPKSSWLDSLNDYLGNNRPADLNWKVLFSDVLKKHTKEEAEEIFICGTSKTTPDMAGVSKDWPHPWLYSRVLLMFLSAFGLLWLCCSHLPFHYRL